MRESRILIVWELERYFVIFVRVDLFFDIFLKKMLIKNISQEKKKGSCVSVASSDKDI